MIGRIIRRLCCKHSFIYFTFPSGRISFSLQHRFITGFEIMSASNTLSSSGGLGNPQAIIKTSKKPQIVTDCF